MQLNEQQEFWSRKYAKDYISKNSDFELSKGIKAWSKMLDRTERINTLLECGSNIGRNINFLNFVLPETEKSIIELSLDAYKIVTEKYKLDQTYNGAIVDSSFKPATFDLVYTMGVLIHIHPDDLLDNLKKMYEYSSKYILIGEYFNRTPVMLEYQGEKDKLFKRDFGRYLMEHFDVKLLDYGFLWGHEYDHSGFDDITYWVFEK